MFDISEYSGYSYLSAVSVFIYCSVITSTLILLLLKQQFLIFILCMHSFPTVFSFKTFIKKTKSQHKYPTITWGQTFAETSSQFHSIPQLQIFTVLPIYFGAIMFLNDSKRRSQQWLHRVWSSGATIKLNSYSYNMVFLWPRVGGWSRTWCRWSTGWCRWEGSRP